MSYSVINNIAPDSEDAAEHLDNVETQITNIFIFGKDFYQI